MTGRGRVFYCDENLWKKIKAWARKKRFDSTSALIREAVKEKMDREDK